MAYVVQTMKCEQMWIVWEKGGREKNKKAVVYS